MDVEQVNKVFHNISDIRTVFSEIKYILPYSSFFYISLIVILYI